MMDGIVLMVVMAVVMMVVVGLNLVAVLVVGQQLRGAPIGGSDVVCEAGGGGGGSSSHALCQLKVPPIQLRLGLVDHNVDTAGDFVCETMERAQLGGAAAV